MALRPLTARPPLVLLREAKPLRALFGEAQRLDRLQQIVESQLQPAARPHCRVASWREGCLLLIITDGHWATRLRYQQRRLQRQLETHEAFAGLQRILFRVQASATDKAGTSSAEADFPGVGGTHKSQRRRYRRPATAGRTGTPCGAWPATRLVCRRERCPPLMRAAALAKGALMLIGALLILLWFILLLRYPLRALPISLGAAAAFALVVGLGNPAGPPAGTAARTAQGDDKLRAQAMPGRPPLAGTVDQSQRQAR